MDYDPDPVLLPGLLEIYGGRWQIDHDDETSAWTAVRRPTPTAMHVLVAASLAGLAGKLAKEEGRDMLAASLDDMDTDPGPRAGEAQPGGGWISGPST